MNYKKFIQTLANAKNVYAGNESLLFLKNLTNEYGLYLLIKRHNDWFFRETTKIIPIYDNADYSFGLKIININQPKLYYNFSMNYSFIDPYSTLNTTSSFVLSTAHIWQLICAHVQTNPLVTFATNILEEYSKNKKSLSLICNRIDSQPRNIQKIDYNAYKASFRFDEYISIDLDRSTEDILSLESQLKIKINKLLMAFRNIDADVIKFNVSREFYSRYNNYATYDRKSKKFDHEKLIDMMPKNYNQQFVNAEKIPLFLNINFIKH